MRFVLICLSLLALPAPAPAQSPTLPGRWKWGAASGIVEIGGNGTGRDPGGHTLQWTLTDPVARVYVLRWSHGYTDTVTLAADGASLTAVNNTGMRFTATRESGGGGGIADEWDWGAIGAVVSIAADGTGRDPRGNTMKWTLQNPAARVYVLRWSHGYTDTATLSADGNTLDAVNNSGTRFKATRRGGTVVPPPPAPVDLNGSWRGGLLHIWQDGGQVLVTAAWKRDDGKYVVWRGEGRLNGRLAELAIRYSPMPHGPQGDWQGVFTVSADGNTIDAVYTQGAARDVQRYVRDR